MLKNANVSVGKDITQSDMLHPKATATEVLESVNLLADPPRENWHQVCLVPGSIDFDALFISVELCWCGSDTFHVFSGGCALCGTI